MPTVAFKTAAGPVTFKTKKMAPKARKAGAPTEVKHVKKLATRPDTKKKQKRVSKILEDKTVQEKLHKK